MVIVLKTSSVSFNEVSPGSHIRNSSSDVIYVDTSQFSAKLTASFNKTFSSRLCTALLPEAGEGETLLPM